MTKVNDRIAFAHPDLGRVTGRVNQIRPDGIGTVLIASADRGPAAGKRTKGGLALYGSPGTSVGFWADRVEILDPACADCGCAAEDHLGPDDDPSLCAGTACKRCGCSDYNDGTE